MNVWRKSRNSEDGVKWVGGCPVARRDPSDREGPEQYRRAPHDRKYTNNEEITKQPEECQMIGLGGGHLVHKMTPAARKALGKLAFGDTS